jgi:Zn-dependent protease with chaperone function
MYPHHSDSDNPPSLKAERAGVGGVRLAIAQFAGSLALASTVTLSLIGGMVLALSLALVLITNSDNPGAGLGLAIAITLLFNLAAFFISPWLMDLTQRWLYKTRWVDLAEISRKSPETADVIQRVCAEKGLKQPRLGIIDDQNPTAFTYGSLPNSARLVVSEGLFTYLDDDEVAAVYAHEMGHIVHWDFAVMTLASTLVQICYLIYVFASRISRGEDSKAKDVARTTSYAAYIFYLVGTYLILYLSRVREYFADHFAAEVTGNPNALSRGLVKIAYGLVEEGKRTQEPSRLLEGTRALGIYDSKAAVMTGTAYRISASPERVGRVFMWDMFNPWAWWMELNSTHPLTGKRIRALSNYAEQLDLAVEFDMAKVVRDGKTLSKKRLYSGFALDLILYGAEFLGLLLGLIAVFILSSQHLGPLVALPLIGLGLGVLVKALVMYPNFAKAQPLDVLELMSDPYASPLRGKPAQLQGTLIGRGQAGYALGSDIQFQDKTGLLYLHYASWLGPLGNLFFGMTRVKGLIGSQGDVTGWFRRGAASYLDLVQIRTESGTIVRSHHRVWSFILGFGLIALGIYLGVHFAGVSLNSLG